MRAWSTIVASGPCLIGNLSAGVASGLCNRQYFRRRGFQSTRGPESNTHVCVRFCRLPAVVVYGLLIFGHATESRRWRNGL